MTHPMLSLSCHRPHRSCRAKPRHPARMVLDCARTERIGGSVHEACRAQSFMPPTSPFVSSEVETPRANGSRLRSNRTDRGAPSMKHPVSLSYHRPHHSYRAQSRHPARMVLDCARTARIGGSVHDASHAQSVMPPTPPFVSSEAETPRANGSRLRSNRTDRGLRP